MAEVNEVLQSIGINPMVKRVVNPIRRIVERMVRPKTETPFISLSIGDPTITKTFFPPKELTDAMIETINSHTADGYAPSFGLLPCREAIAKAYSTSKQTIAPDDVTVCSGASHAIELAIEALCPPKSILLIPRPGFALYNTLAAAREIESEYYPCDPAKEWEVDLDALRALLTARAAPVGAASRGEADGKITAIVLCNPSNPCGSVWSSAHCAALGDLLGEFPGVTVLSDEIYAGLVFDTSKPPPKQLGELSFAAHAHHPLLVVGGLAKRYMVPGWRLGWVVLANGEAARDGDAKVCGASVRAALHELSTMILGPNSITQASVPAALALTPDAPYHIDNNQRLGHLAKVFRERVDAIDGLDSVVSAGAMYTMVRVDCAAFGFAEGDDVAFSAALLQEENVMVLPGTIFEAPGFFRVVICNAQSVLEEAVDRMRSFCDKHRVVKA